MGTNGNRKSKGRRQHGGSVNGTVIKRANYVTLSGADYFAFFVGLMNER